MGLNIANLGSTTAVAVTDTDDSVTLGGNWQAAYVLSTVDCHITVNGAAATTSDMLVIAKERLPIYVDFGPDENGPGGGTVHFVKAEGASDGTIYITEVC